MGKNKDGDIIAKSEKTLRLETDIWKATYKKGMFGCFEVTIGFSGVERVDYLTYDTEGIWRFYEIKVTKADFHSKANKTFLGHYNYYVMPYELFQLVKDEIPEHIGVWIGDSCVKKAKKQELGIDETILKDSLIRSLYREAEKVYKSENPILATLLQRKLNKAQKEAEEYKQNYNKLMRIGHEKYGMRWYKDYDS
jgi:hypothetical protein